ncbi:hypothetical protein Tco_1204797 [Tanacetum coccineum]
MVMLTLTLWNPLSLVPNLGSETILSMQDLDNIHLWMMTHSWWIPGGVPVGPDDAPTPTDRLLLQRKGMWIFRMILTSMDYLVMASTALGHDQPAVPSEDVEEREKEEGEDAQARKRFEEEQALVRRKKRRRSLDRFNGIDHSKGKPMKKSEVTQMVRNLVKYQCLDTPMAWLCFSSMLGGAFGATSMFTDIYYHTYSSYGSSAVHAVSLVFHRLQISVLGSFTFLSSSQLLWKSILVCHRVVAVLTTDDEVIAEIILGDVGLELWEGCESCCVSPLHPCMQSVDDFWLYKQDDKMVLSSWEVAILKSSVHAGLRRITMRVLHMSPMLPLKCDGYSFLCSVADEKWLVKEGYGYLFMSVSFDAAICMLLLTVSAELYCCCWFIVSALVIYGCGSFVLAGLHLYLMLLCFYCYSILLLRRAIYLDVRFADGIKWFNAGSLK